MIDTAHLHGALGGFKRLALTKFAEDAKVPGMGPGDLEKSWENVGEIWENQGKNKGKPEEKLGKPWEKLGKSWKHLGSLWKM